MMHKVPLPSAVAVEAWLVMEHQGSSFGLAGLKILAGQA
jgi:hypothetical protein